jgi:anti-sigma regulatory factor (Ser/Thr protein kinase)
MDRELRLSLPCVHRAVRIGRRVVQAFARTDGWSDAEIEELMLITSELLANAVDHGGGDGAMSEEDLKAPVRMGLFLSARDTDWRLEIEDGGAGDVALAQSLIDNSSLVDLEDERGRGLVREMVDELGVRAGATGLVFFVAKRRVGDSCG